MFEDVVFEVLLLCLNLAFYVTNCSHGGCKTQTTDCRLAELRGLFGVSEHRVVRTLITVVSDSLDCSQF